MSLSRKSKADIDRLRYEMAKLELIQNPQDMELRELVRVYELCQKSLQDWPDENLSNVADVMRVSKAEMVGFIHDLIGESWASCRSREKLECARVIAGWAKKHQRNLAA